MRRVTGFTPSGGSLSSLSSSSGGSRSSLSNLLKNAPRVQHTVSWANALIQTKNLARLRAALNDPSLRNGNNRNRIEKAYVAGLLRSNRATVRAALNSYPFFSTNRYYLLMYHGNAPMIQNALSTYRFNSNQASALRNVWAVRKLNKRQIQNMIHQISSGPGPRSRIAQETLRVLHRELKN